MKGMNIFCFKVDIHIPSAKHTNRFQCIYRANREADLIKTMSTLPRLHADIRAFSRFRPLIVVPLPTSEYIPANCQFGFALIRSS